MEEKLATAEELSGVPRSDVRTVADLNALVGETVAADARLSPVYVLGEVRDCSHSAQGHLFFDLADQDASVSCVCFDHADDDAVIDLEQGDEVLVVGDVDYYEARGDITLKVREIYLVGEGAYYQQRRKRIKQLRKEGLFAAEAKQPVPDMPERVGIVTSKDGAAVRDMVNTVRDRFPAVDVYVRHSAVQGEHAADELVDGLRFLDEEFDVDVILVGRGGGSAEDLQAFDSEAVARAIYACETPVVTGVGHRTDETIAGYVADHGAITPTAAAKAAVPDAATLYDRLDALEEQVTEQAELTVETREQADRIDLLQYRERLYQGTIILLTVALVLTRYGVI